MLHFGIYKADSLWYTKALQWVKAQKMQNLVNLRMETARVKELER
jgi:hypothetical protein